MLKENFGTFVHVAFRNTSKISWKIKNEYPVLKIWMAGSPARSCTISIIVNAKQDVNSCTKMSPLQMMVCLSVYKDLQWKEHVVLYLNILLKWFPLSPHHFSKFVYGMDTT
jgi:hypothetical protein